MGRTYQSGISTTKDKRGQLAPSPTAGPTDPGIFSGALPPDRGILRPKGNVQGGNVSGAKVNRPGTLERHGARQRIEVPLRGAQAPEAAATQANGRIIPSYSKTQDAWSSGDFWGAGG